jgi:hypothetical protein
VCTEYRLDRQGNTQDRARETETGQGEGEVREKDTEVSLIL